MTNHLVLYHGPCTDGFTAAWAAWSVLKDKAEYVEAVHGAAPPDVTGKHVYILDFAYPRETMLAMQASAASVTLLDHHKSAQNALVGLAGCEFDMHRSGAGLAWDHFIGNDRPLLVNIVEDSDLNLFSNPLTVPLIARLEIEPRTFANWSRIAALLEDPVERAVWLKEAELLLAQKEVFYQQSLKMRYVLSLGGFEGLACNAPYWAASELGNRLGRLSGTFGLVWHRTGTELKCSLRSNRGGFDVANLAAMFDGGGHQNSAAFVLPATPRNLSLLNGIEKIETP